MLECKRFAIGALGFSSIILGGASAAFASESATNVGESLAKMATCAITERDDGKSTYAMFFLAGYESNGTAYYRTISAPIFELTVRPDKSVDSTANPCKSELKFLD